VRIFEVLRHPRQHMLFMRNSRAAMELFLFTIVFVFHMFTVTGQSKNSHQDFITLEHLTTEDPESAVNMLLNGINLNL
jgi:hypothetical protein